MALHVGRVRVNIHPLLLMLPLMAMRLSAGGEAAALFAALCCHESAHLLAARWLGVGVSHLRLMPFGGAIILDNPYVLTRGQLLGVAAAGPVGSLLALIFAAALAHWRVLSPGAALALIRANGMLLGFNLLPALPLDGGRMLYALLHPRLGRRRAVALGIHLGRGVAAALIALAVYGAIAGGRLNLSLLVCAVFMLAAAPEERRALSQVRVQTLLNELKPMGTPIPVRLWAVDGSCPVKAALRAADPGALALFAVYEQGRLAGFTDDRALLRAALDHPEIAAVARAVSLADLPTA